MLLCLVHRIPPLLLIVTLACAGERAEVGDTNATAESGCFGCSCSDELPCAVGLECTQDVCSLIEETGSDEGAPPSACGWNPAESWYDCGFQGQDPTREFPRACPIDSEPHAPCPSALTFEGCCDTQGDVWYCDEGRVVMTHC